MADPRRQFLLDQLEQLRERRRKREQPPKLSAREQLIEQGGLSPEEVRKSARRSLLGETRPITPRTPTAKETGITGLLEKGLIEPATADSLRSGIPIGKPLSQQQLQQAEKSKLLTKPVIDFLKTGKRPTTEAGRIAVEKEFGKDVFGRITAKTKTEKQKASQTKAFTKYQQALAGIKTIELEINNLETRILENKLTLLPETEKVIFDALQKQLDIHERTKAKYELEDVSKEDALKELRKRGL